MKTTHLLITLILFAALTFAGCGSRAQVGELRTESHSVELDNAKSVRVEVAVVAAELNVSGGADNLLDADFAYNVAQMKPEVEYKNGTLIVRHATINGFSSLQGITGYRNEWNLRLYDKVPMDLSVDLGAGAGDLQLAGLSLTGLDVSLGMGEYTVDLSGDWVHDLQVAIDAGAANIRLRLPSEIGVRVEVGEGPHTVESTGLTKDGNVYTNSAYGVSEVTLQVNVEAGIGQINLEVEK